MPDSQHTLEIVTKTKDLASKPLANIGKAGQKVGKQTAAGLNKATQAAKLNKRSLLDAGAAGSKAAGIAGAGFSSLAAGISAANATAENFEASMVSVGASVATAFATGGPLGAGIALVSVGIGALISELNSAEREAEEMAKKWEEVGRRSADAIKGITAANRDLVNELNELNAELHGGEFDRKRVETLQKINDLESDRLGKIKEADAAAADGQAHVAKRLDAEADALHARQETLRRILIAREDHKLLAEEEAEAAERLKQEQEEILALQESRAKEAAELEEIAEREAQLADDLQAALERLTPEYEKQTDELGQHFDLYKRLISEGYDYEAKSLKEAIAAQKERKQLAIDQKKAEQDVARELEKQRQEQERFNRTKEQAIQRVREEIELLDARNDEEEQAIRNARERRDLLSAGVSAQDIDTLFSARRADEAERAAEAAGTEADNLERAARASGKVQDSGRRRGRRPKSFNRQRPTFGVQFSFGGSGRRPKKKLDEQGRAVLPDGFRYTTKDEQAADQRRIERELWGGASPEPSQGSGGAAENTQRAAEGAGQVAQAQQKNADAAGLLATNVEKVIPPTEQISTGIDQAAQSFTSLATAIDRNSGSVDKFASQVESTSTTTAQAVERTATKLDRLITQLVNAQVISGGV